MGAKKKPQETIALAELGVLPDEAGEAGSGTVVRELKQPPPRGESVVVEDDGSAPQRIVDYLAEQKLV
jgi:electron transfer flavoprotein beta subunit